MSRLPAAAPVQLSAEPNVTPLIDVLLVLLVIFMLTLRVRHTLPAQVPPPAAAPETPGPGERRQIVLELTAGGGYVVNGQPVPLAELDSYLRAIYADRPAKLIFVQAAPERAYAEVIAAMDLARGAGVQLLGLMPQPSGR